MTAPTTSSRIARATDAYVDAVAAALDRAGVSDPERQELLDDLTGHLAELEAEDGDALTAQLGPPADYAAELLVSAGIEVEVAPDPAGDPWWPRARAALQRAVDARPVAALRAFWPELRGGWWVARGWAAVVIYAKLTRGNVEVFPLPKVFADVFPSYVLLAAVVVASVGLGRQPGRVWLNRAATAVGIIGVIVAANVDLPDNDDYGYPAQDMILTPGGYPVTQLWPFDADGNPLAQVFLFDQLGNPVSLGQTYAGPDGVPGMFPARDASDPYGAAPEDRPAVLVPRLPGATTTTTAPAG